MNLLTMIEVFKTSVEDKIDATRLIDLLRSHFPYCRINFDLWDCDRILRVEGMDFNTGKIIELVKSNGFTCSILDSEDFHE